MPIQSRKIAVRDVRPIYLVILEHLHSLHPDWVEKAKHPELNKDVPAKISRSYGLAAISHLSQACGWSTDLKGGHFYEFYRKMRPSRNVNTDLDDWGNPNAYIPLTLFTLRGLFSYIESNKLENRVPDFNNLREELIGLFDPGNSKVRSSNISEANREALKEYMQAPHSISFPDSWKKSRWLCYERTDAGICISKMELEEEGGIVFASYNTKYFDGENNIDYSYRGIAYLDNGGDNIVVNLFRKQQPGNYASFIMRLDKYNDRSQKLSIGHHTYYAIRFRRYVTKRVIWTLYEKGMSQPFEARELERSEKNDFLAINPVIRRFLFYKDTNRLSQPEPILRMLEGKATSLQHWLKDYLTPSETDEVLHSLRDSNQKYLLFFHRGNPGKKSKQPTLQKVEFNFTKEGVGLPPEMSETIAFFKFEEIERTGRVIREDSNLYISFTTKGKITTPFYPHNFSTSMILYLPDSLLRQQAAIKETELIFNGHMIGLANSTHQPDAFKVCLLPEATYLSNQKKWEKIVMEQLR